MGMTPVGLAINPPAQPQGPIQQAEGALSVQAMIAQDRLRRQAEQSNAVGLQQQQLQLQQQQEQEQQAQQEQADAQKFRQAYQEANGNWGDAIEKAKKAGVGPATISKLEAGNLDHITKLANLTKQQQDNLEKHNEMIGQVALATKNTSPDKRDQVYQQGRNQLILSGVAKEGELPATAPTDDELDAHIAQGQHLKDNLEQARQLQKQNAELPGIQADARQKVFSSAATVMGGVPSNQLGWTAGRNMVLKSNPELAPLIPEEFSPAAAESVRQLAIPPDKRNVTETELAIRSVAGDKQAEAALKRLDESKRASRPINQMGGMGSTDIKDIADAIENGDQPPTLQGLYRNGGPVRAELARRGVPIAKMETDWKATQKYIGTLNGPQQTRLRQDISTVSDSLDKVEGLYNEWRQLAPTSGFKILNRASLLAMKQLPGRPGAVAQALEAQIADTTAGLGTIYMGGNSPTDHSLGLAAKSLSADWNDDTFNEALKQARANVKIRENSITHSMPAGTSANNMYQPPAAAIPAAAPATAGIPAGAPSAPAEDGHKLKMNGKVIGISKGGQWQPVQQP